MKKIFVLIILSLSTQVYANAYTTNCNEYGCTSRGSDTNSQVCTTDCNEFGCTTRCS